MSEDEDFAALFEASQRKQPKQATRLQAGQTVRGTVVAIADDVVFVDIGGRVEARLARSAVTNDRGELTVAIGDPISATVADPGGRNPPELKTSFGGAGGATPDDLVLAARAGTPVEGEFTKAVKAGLEVDVGGVRAFCPASQVDANYVADLETFVGQRHFFKVLEVRDGGRSVVVSRKAMMLEERKQRAQSLLQQLEVGSDLDGIVQSLQPYGAFIDLGGIAGLLHVSEISHARVSSPSDVLAVGEKVRVRVTSMDTPAGSDQPRISLSMKVLVQEPASGRTDLAGEVLTATVAKVEPFGVLIESPQGSGLVPLAELDLPRGSDPRRAFKPGDAIQVVSLRPDPSGKLRFSARAVREVEEKQAFQAFAKQQPKAGEKLGSMAALLQGIEVPDRANASETPARPETVKPEGARRKVGSPPVPRRRGSGQR